MGEFKNIFMEKAGDRREEFELGFLLDTWTSQEIATELGINVIIVKEHMKRHIPLEVREKMVSYLPSTASQCAELLVKTKGKAMELLSTDDMEDRDIRLLTTLIQSAAKFLEKWGQVTEGIAGLEANQTVNYFEIASMQVLVNHPEVFIEIKNKMKELEGCQ